MLDASGHVVARRQAAVSAKIMGKVAVVLIEEGQRVEREPVLARLDDANARAELNQATFRPGLTECSRSTLRRADVAVSGVRRPVVVRTQAFQPHALRLDQLLACALQNSRSRWHIALLWLGADIAFVEIGTLCHALELDHGQKDPYQHHDEREHTNEEEACLIHDCRAPLTASLK